MYLETTILNIYKFLILYGCLFRFFFLYTRASASLKSCVHLWSFLFFIFIFIFSNLTHIFRYSVSCFYRLSSPLWVPNSIQEQLIFQVCSVSVSPFWLLTSFIHICVMLCILANPAKSLQFGLWLVGGKPPLPEYFLLNFVQVIKAFFIKYCWGFFFFSFKKS